MQIKSLVHSSIFPLTADSQGHYYYNIPEENNFKMLAKLLIAAIARK